MENNKVYFEDLTPEQQKEFLDNIPTPEKEKEHFDLYCQRFDDYYQKSFRELNDRTITLERLKRKRHNFYDLLAKLRMAYRDIYIQKTKPLIYSNLPELNEQKRQRWEYQIETLQDLITSANNQIEGFSFRKTFPKETHQNKINDHMEAESIGENEQDVQMLIPLRIEEIAELISNKYKPFRIYGNPKIILQENPDKEPIEIVTNGERSFVRFKPDKYDYKTKDEYNKITDLLRSLTELKQLQERLSNTSWESSDYNKLKSEVVKRYKLVFGNIDKTKTQNSSLNFQNPDNRQLEKDRKQKYTHAQIALIHIYSKESILDPNTDIDRKANVIAAKFGFISPSSGFQLYKKFQKLDGNSAQRTGVKNKKKMSEDIEAILPYLTDKGAIDKAKSELLKLKESEESE